MLSILGTILIGLVVGFIARAVKPGDDKLDWIASVVGAVILLFIYGLVAKKS